MAAKHPNKEGLFLSKGASPKEERNEHEDRQNHRTPQTAPSEQTSNATPVSAISVITRNAPRSKTISSIGTAPTTSSKTTTCLTGRSSTATRTPSDSAPAATRTSAPSSTSSSSRLNPPRLPPTPSSAPSRLFLPQGRWHLGRTPQESGLPDRPQSSLRKPPHFPDRRTPSAEPNFPGRRGG